MKTLVIGSGGREHAIADALNKSSIIEKVYVSPGNSGMSNVAETVSLSGFDAIAEFVQVNNISFVFIGPEQPLADGIVDYLKERNIAVIGPDKAGSQIESSKIWSKNLMKKYGVPTAEYGVYDNYESACKGLDSFELPVVIKADGLAAGKGVIIAESRQEAEDALKVMMTEMKFGESGSSVVIEEFLEGWETSIFALSDGENYVSTVFSQDFKRAFDNDKGPNTGGMGAYAPVVEAEQYRDVVHTDIFDRIFSGMKTEGIIYTGILYAGLMITENGPKVIEFNCRFGDPETEVVLPLLKSDFGQVCKALVDNAVNKVELEWENCAVTVVAASGGYPEAYKKGMPIEIPELEKGNEFIYYAGVKSDNDKMLTDGGRVLMAVAVKDSMEEARHSAYKIIDQISFNKMQYRNDIAKKAR